MDRDPDMFKILLKFLRTGKLPEGLSRGQLKELATEADFFQLSNLTDAIKCLSTNYDTLENSKALQFRILNIFGKNGFTGHNYQSENLIVAKRSWFGNIPVHVIVKLLESSFSSLCNQQIKEINELVESCEMNDYVTDRDGNICIFAQEPSVVIANISSLVKKDQHYIWKVIDYLRDYYYTDKKQNEDIEITINEQKFQCKFSALQFMKVSELIDSHGKLLTEFGEIVRSEEQETRFGSDAELIKSILRRLEKGHVGSQRPPNNSALFNDSSVEFLPSNLYFNQL